MRKILPYLFCCLLVLQTKAQAGKDTVLVKQVTVKGQGLQDGTSVHYQVDSLYAASMPLANVGDLLNAASPVFLKSYGGGASSTLSIRGTGASQNNLLWNGIQVNAPTFGLADFSNMPFFMMDDAQLLYDSKAMRYGTGALGGAVQLVNTPDWNPKPGLALQLNAGSFDNYKAGARLRLGKKNWRNITKGFYTQTQNDYPFRNNTLPGNPEEKLKHAAFQQAAITNETYIILRKRDLFSIRGWWQEGSREIPPLLFNSANPVRETQYDRAFRLMGELRIPRSTYDISVKSAYMDETLIYRNPDAAIYESYQTRSVKNLFSLRQKLGKKWTLDYVGNNDRVWLLNNRKYSAPPMQNRIGISLSANYKREKMAATALVRQEAVDRAIIPTAANLGVLFLLKKSVSVSANLHRNTKYPSLNDLYWTQGGNPNLQPELAHGGNAGVQWAGKYLKYTGVLFAQLVDNWILWTPGNGGYFTAQNLKKVRLAGTEQMLQANFTLWKQHAFRAQVSWNFQSAVNMEDIFPGDGSAGKQLIYTPANRVRSFFMWKYRSWGAFVQHQFTGYTYTTSDNNNWLEPYQLMDLGISFQSAKNKNYPWNLLLKCNNLLNANYQVIAWRPMAGRNFEALLQIQIHP